MEKCLLLQSAFSTALVGWTFFEEKKLDAGFEIFHIFYAKKRPFFDFWTPLFLGRTPEKKWHFTKNFEPEKSGSKKSQKCQKKNPGLRPENRTVQQLPKRSFFGFKNVKNFKSGIQFFFLKNFSSHQRGQKCTLHKKALFQWKQCF